MKFETLAVHGAQQPDPSTGALITPIYQTSTFVFEDVGKTRGYDYSRTSNPTRKVLEDLISQLEGGKGACATATGMAAETTVACLLKQGDHVICGDDVYGGTYRLFDSVMRDLGVDCTFLRLDDRSRLGAAVRPNTRMIWLETPSNPLLNIVDLEMVAEVAGKHNLLTVADNTFATPYFLRPIDYGIDIVVHSTTKYLNGHCDVVGGAIVASTEELAEKVRYLTNAMGTPASPFDCWLVLRGIKTLAIRMRQQEATAAVIARYLKKHNRISRVYYPGLEDHPGHETAGRQMKGFGAVVSFEVKGGLEAVNSVLSKTGIFALAESLGGVDSLIEHPATMSHASMPEPARETIGIGPQLIRLSIGLEHVDDLIEDLEQALIGT